ncbi:RagB/SusD family nutrient uptake outer membrane protein [Sphingobacterium yanglingense]|uniref:SusD-like starch-binding protein associating with outer membrane n=1 Tax=Sphingobacterium yanglingense TaxID=1437280 RepID=A0A4R6WJ09_9SPHI|nr:RagB/SusD family nutrient uptake outer membrane protein [Sphingobacterium yanglingense]TDQ80144.1 SusD-like starch-binding protein associating with outer membrane [Sphingobacterium yanglingense]
MKRIFIILILGMMVTSCEQEFLSVKPSSNIIRPQTLEDLEQMLDNNLVINVSGVLQRIASDEYYIASPEIWQGLFSSTQRNAYLWKADLYEGETNIKDWDNLYTAIFYANSVLDELSRIDGEEQRKSDIRGRALFIRAYALFDLVNTFAPFYDTKSATIDNGVPIRLSADVNQTEKRATVKSCYERIITDLDEAAKLISAKTPPGLRTRQSKAAVYALLSKVYFFMQDFEKAETYASTCLSLYSTITDFNQLQTNTDQPFQGNNADVIYYTTQVMDYTTTSGVGSLTGNYIGMDTELVKLYEPADIRPQVFFNKNSQGRNYRKMMYGSVSNNLYPFTGLATDEIYLIKAESLARIGDLVESKNTLLQLLQKRFPKGHNFGIDKLDQHDLIERVLLERRKELVWRSVRWTELKRLNALGHTTVLQREFKGEVYELSFDNANATFPIPENELIHLF